MILSQQQIGSLQQALLWQAYHSEFNQKNQFGHWTPNVNPAVLSSSLVPKPSQVREAMF